MLLRSPRAEDLPVHQILGDLAPDHPDNVFGNHLVGPGPGFAGSSPQVGRSDHVPETKQFAGRVRRLALIDIRPIPADSLFTERRL